MGGGLAGAAPSQEPRPCTPCFRHSALCALPLQHVIYHNKSSLRCSIVTHLIIYTPRLLCIHTACIQCYSESRTRNLYVSFGLDSIVRPKYAETSPIQHWVSSHSWRLAVAYTVNSFERDVLFACICYCCHRRQSWQFLVPN